MTASSLHSDVANESVPLAPAALKVLLISLFHPELVRGGAQQICYELFEGLKEMPGVKPTLLASIDSSLPALYKSGARITGFDGRDGEFLFLSTEYDYWWHRTSSPLLLEAYADFLRMLAPDVVHIHHFLTLGVELITLTRKVLPHARIVFTFHEFMTICAADGHMVRKHDKSLCTHASPVRCHQCFPELPPEQFFVREKWMKKHMEPVDVFTTPSQFMIKHYTDWGIDQKRIFQVGNVQRNRGSSAVAAEPRARRNRFGFFGQMVDMKGIHVILRAVEYLRASGFTDFVVEINGDNIRYASEERRKDIQEFLEREGQKPVAEQNVVFNGSYQVDQLAGRMARIDWCIVPSIWWEIFCLVISEAWMFGRPVIVSNVGGPLERVRHQVDGLHFQVGDPQSLANAMKRACTEEGLWDRLSAGITPPASRDVMVAEYVALYRTDESSNDGQIKQMNNNGVLASR
jgi:glycosyltransferase involved in cell wall biosynthesis